MTRVKLLLLAGDYVEDYEVRGRGSGSLCSWTVVFGVGTRACDLLARGAFLWRATGRGEEALSDSFGSGQKGGAAPTPAHSAGAARLPAAAYLPAAACLPAPPADHGALSSAPDGGLPGEPHPICCTAYRAVKPTPCSRRRTPHPLATCNLPSPQVDAVCPGKKAGDMCRTAVHEFEARVPLRLSAGPAGARRACALGWLRGADPSQLPTTTACMPGCAACSSPAWPCPPLPLYNGGSMNSYPTRHCRETRRTARSRGTTLC